ncbi:MAG: DegV family protein [Dehalococcoidia bacterium]
MAVRIVTDSTADLPLPLAQELGISVVPLSVIFGGESFREGIDISHDQFYEKLVRSKELPTTSAPSVGDFLAVYEPLLAETSEIVSIHLSSKLSATYGNACQAAQIMAERGVRVEVIDSRLITSGMAFVAVAAARAAQGEAGLEEVRQVVERLIPRVRIYVVLDTLEYLRRGGRIGRAGAFLGALLKVKPILSVREGEIYPEERVRTRAHAFDKVVQIAASHARTQELAIGYSTNHEDAEEMQRRLSEALPGADVQITRVGPVIGAHCGPGVLGIVLLEGED